MYMLYISLFFYEFIYFCAARFCWGCIFWMCKRNFLWNKCFNWRKNGVRLEISGWERKKRCVLRVATAFWHAKNVFVLKQRLEWKIIDFYTLLDVKIYDSYSDLKIKDLRIYILFQKKIDIRNLKLLDQWFFDHEYTFCDVKMK